MQGMGRESYKSLTKTDGEDKGECPRLTIPQRLADFSDKDSFAPSSRKAAKVGWRREDRKNRRTDLTQPEKANLFSTSPFCL